MSDVRSFDDSLMLVERIRNMGAMASTAKSAARFIKVEAQGAELDLVETAAELDTVIEKVKNATLKGILEAKVQLIMQKSA